MILALDLATNTGVCAGAGDTLPSLRRVRLPSTGEDVGRFLVAFEDWLRPLVEEVEPTLIVYESPLLGADGSIHTRRKLFGLAGVTEMIAHREGLDCREVAATSAKKALTGSGRAEKWQMVEACRAYGLDPHTYIKDGRDASDEADSFAVWLAALRVMRPAVADRWKPLIMGVSA